MQPRLTSFYVNPLLSKGDDKMGSNPISINPPDHKRASTKMATGPRSDAGKRRSCMNAVRRGIFASSVLVEGESAARYESLRRALMADLPDDAGATECILTEKLAINLWRQARFYRAEREDIFRSIEQAPDSCAVSKIDRLQGERDAISEALHTLQEFVPLAEIVERFMSYERHLGREFDRTLDQLERVRRMRLNGSAALTPTVGEFSAAKKRQKASTETSIKE
jgi:hypothetical protein